MTRPQIVRADTIDLQDHISPSAQDHSHLRSPLKPNATSSSVAPHQAETLRSVAVELAEENSRSPRGSWANGAEADDIQSYAQDPDSGAAASNMQQSQPQQSQQQQQQQQQQDTLAIAQNGGHVSDDGDMDDVDDGLDDDMMDKISSSPSIEDEDIDFEFVYALHTFVATVEGQANATKGDTMVLLDDSNSYWWLVRVVKDSSIGYLPAEHIETPTERLARLNKHRNIDLSATMLGDQAEKPKNPIKTAMRRRKAKTVTFSDPTIHAYSDYDYSSEEEDLENEFFARQQQQGQQQDEQSTDQDDLEDESAKVQPLSMKSPPASVEAPKPEKSDANPSIRSEDTTRTSDEIFESKLEPSRSRNGTVRNTDSFFKDETVETKKITLTPNLLRDDNEPRVSSDSSKELRSRPSLDKLERDDKKDDKKRKDKDKKDKDKKPGVIRSLFSRGKDKKKTSDEDNDPGGKRSFDTGGELQEKVSEEFTQVEESPSDRSEPQRHPSKLQKQQPRGDPSPTRKPTSTAKEPQGASMRLVSSDEVEGVQRPLQSAPGDMKQAAKTSGQSNDVRMVPGPNESGNKTPVNQPEPSQPSLKPVKSTQPGAYPDGYTNSVNGTLVAEEAPPQQGERLSESPVHVSPVNNMPPALIGDTSSQEGQSSPISSPSPELVEADDADGNRNEDSITTSTSTGTMSTWNDANLRAFFDSGTAIRDLLAIVYDKSDVPPAGPDHPVAGLLFKEPSAKLAEITNQLDNMLGDWLARKQRTRGTL